MSKPSTELRLLRYVLPYRALFLLGLTTTFLASVLDGFTLVVLIPLLKYLFGTAGVLTTGSTRLEAVLDRLMNPLLAGTTPIQALGRAVLVLFGGLLVKNAMGYASRQLSVRIQEGLVRDLRTQAFEHLLHVDLQFFQRTRAGQLVSRLTTDVDNCRGAVTAASSLFQYVVVIVTTLIILTSLSWRLTLMTLACAPILLLGVQLVIRQLRRHSRDRAEQGGEVTATVTERLAAVKLIRAYRGEERESARFMDQAVRYRKRAIRAERFASLTGPMTEVFGGAVVILIILAGKTGALGGAPLSPQSVIVFLVAALRMMSPLKAITQFPASMAGARASAERVFEVLDRPALDLDPPGLPRARFERDIVYDHVSFRYESHAEVLRDVSLRIQRGQVVALVGPSGAGKTTMVDLLPRFYDPTGGSILLDGVSITSLDRGSVRGLIGVVGQDTVLLNDTVHANIAYARPEATRAEVERAARAANAHEFVSALPQGYDTLLGERGTRLSGGQRQRVAIARALLKDPPILVLDEATSALDAESERLVQQAIDRLMQDRTVLVIAHRLATVRHADQIVVLEAGEITERGSHADLLAEGRLYRRLYELQFKDEIAPAVQ